MNRDTPMFYERSSASKPTHSRSYSRKFDSTESTKPTMLVSNSSFSNENKENYFPAIPGGTGEALLKKCKQTIEELHLELEAEKKLRSRLEALLAESENDCEQKDSQLREIRYKQEKLQDELRSAKTLNQSLTKDLGNAEEQLKAASVKEVEHNELQRDFQEVCKMNNEMRERIEELSKEVAKRDGTIKEWNETLLSIQKKVLSLEEENKSLKRTEQELIDDNRRLKIFVEESENTNQLLRNKYEDIERLVQELQNENKIIDSMREYKQNEKLRDEIIEYERNIEALNEENHVNALQLENQFMKEKEKLEEELKEKHRKKMGEQQESYEREIYQLKEASEAVKGELYKVQGERDGLREEVIRLEDRLARADVEGRKITGAISENYESLMRHKDQEVNRLRDIVEEQRRLLSGNEKEKAESVARVQGLLEQNTLMREEIGELRTKNELLSNKLKECQGELGYLKNEVHRNFKTEEEKQNLFEEKLNMLEADLVNRNTSIARLTEELENMKAVARRQTEEIETLTNIKREISEELIYTKRQLVEVTLENDELKQKQRDFNEILEGKITQISNELRDEQEARIKEQSRCKAYQERIIELEAKTKRYRKLLEYPQENEVTKSQNIRKEVSTQNSHRTEKVNKSHRSQVKKTEETPRTVNNKVDISKQPGPAPREFTPRTVMNKFKSVIERLENKLENITAEINASTTN